MKKDSPHYIIVDTCSLLRREGQKFVRHNAERQDCSILLPRMVYQELWRFVWQKKKLKYCALNALTRLRTACIQPMERSGKFAVADDEIVNYCRFPNKAPQYVCTEDKKLRQRIAEVNPAVQLMTASQLHHIMA